MPAAARTRTPPPSASAAESRVHVVQGEFHVSADPTVVLSTILGSCVAACLYDPVARVGGMNHFLLPGSDRDSDETQHGLRYGVHAMELLINGLLRSGARRDRLEAKLFGGARMLHGLTDVGHQNATFAERFLQEEQVVLVGSSLRGDRGRRIQFWPIGGRSRQQLLAPNEQTVFVSERRAEPVIPEVSGGVELF